MSKLEKTLESWQFFRWDGKRQTEMNWFRLSNRKIHTEQNGTEKTDRICFLHFVDGIPTKTNPLPTMDMICSTKRQNTWFPHGILRVWFPPFWGHILHMPTGTSLEKFSSTFWQLPKSWNKVVSSSIWQLVTPSWQIVFHK